MTGDLSQFRDHCARMATAQHRPECSHRPPRHMRPVHPDPTCPGCVTDAERALFAQMAAEVDAYRAPQVDLFGALTDEPTMTEDV